MHMNETDLRRDRESKNRRKKPSKGLLEKRRCFQLFFDEVYFLTCIDSYGNLLNRVQIMVLDAERCKDNYCFELALV